MKIERIGNAVLYHAKMEDVISTIRFDHIFSDPPYLYIKTHDFDKAFDEALLFENAKRILPDNGFIALFGRGTSFYRWNTHLAELGFVFKEEIVWDKRRVSSPLLALRRVHETVSVHTKKTGKIRRSNIPYLEQKEHDINGIVADVKRIITSINNKNGLEEIINFAETGETKYKYIKEGHKLTVSVSKSKDIGIGRLKSIQNGLGEKSIIQTSASRCNNVHPAEKPVRLAERIIALISDPGDTIYDPFMGSGSFGIACIRTGRKYIGSEMKAEYFDIARKRISEISNQELFKEASHG
jgi:site-specific DNA-methyltransferase (adenine-specific)